MRHRPFETVHRRSVGAPIAILVGAWLVFGCASMSHGRMDADGAQQFTFGYSARLLFDVPSRDAQAALELWGREVHRLAGHNIQMRSIIYEDLRTMIDAVQNSELDLVALSTLDYLRFSDRIPLEPALVGNKGNGSHEEHVLLVRSDSGISRIEDVRGKRLVVPTGNVGEMALLWLDTLLFRRGLSDTAGHVAEVKTASRTQQALLSVFFGQADAAVVPGSGFATSVELNPQVGRQLTTIATSPTLLPGLMGFRKGLAAEQKRIVTEASLDLKNSATGRQILMLFKIREVARFSSEDMAQLIGLLREHAASQWKRGGR
jgi:ABC-type phosphate/phosphonate transport system substrate-binding protein